MTTNTTRRAAHKPAAKHLHTPSARAATPTTSPIGPGTRTTPPPIPAGTPAAPDGLRQTTGYTTYELCASQCSGAVPVSLRRPLHLPAGGCPVSAPSGPVSLVGSPTKIKMMQFIGSAWEGAEVTWRETGGYSGPVLIRGRELGGPHALGFGEGHTPYDELQLLGTAMGAPRGEWPSFIRVRGAGCYAIQIDGTSFSKVLVFQAIG